jgi:hypothetical protein
VPNLGATAALPTTGFVGKKATNGLIEDEDDDSQLQDAKDFNDDSIIKTSKQSKMIETVIPETKKEEEALAPASAHMLMHSVASDVLLDLAQFLRTTNDAKIEGDEFSHTRPLNQSLTSVNSSAVSEATKASLVKQQSIGSVIEENPREDSDSAATPFFGAALRQLQAGSKPAAAEADSKLLTNDSSRSSVSSFANDEGSVASSSLNPSEAGALAAWNRRGSQLDKIDETLGNTSGAFSHSPSEELDNFDHALKINPIEQKLIDQRNEMFSTAAQ